MTYTVDCIQFFNELDVLEIRLAELHDIVDRFVLIESTVTHKGDPKPLYFAENRRRFWRYNDKIVNITVGDLPEGTSQAAIWRREIGQRQAILRGLQDVPDDAIVLVSDADEIPRREAVQAVVNHQKLTSFLDDTVVTFKQQLYYYNINTACTTVEWLGTRATLAANVRALMPDGVRWSGLRSHEYPKHAFVNGDTIGMPGRSAGWHLSYFGDVAHIQRKMQAFLHQELVNEETLDPDTIARRMAAGIDIWGREQEQQFELRSASDLPRAMRADPARWLNYFHPDWRPTFHENWCDPEQALFLGWLATQAPLEGACVEIGCWEGRSAVAIAQAIQPRILHCVDHWRGNEDEGHEGSVQTARERNIFATFHGNIDRLTTGNTEHYIMDWRDWVKDQNDPIAFLHLDASHDEASVRECLEAVKPYLVPGAILCGDDSYAHGVWAGVQAALGDGVQDMNGRLWVWQKSL